MLLNSVISPEAASSREVCFLRGQLKGRLACLVGDELLVDLAVVHFLLDCTTGDEAVHRDGPLLAHPPCTFPRLGVCCRVPIRVHYQHPVDHRARLHSTEISLVKGIQKALISGFAHNTKCQELVSRDFGRISRMAAIRFVPSQCVTFTLALGFY